MTALSFSLLVGKIGRIRHDNSENFGEATQDEHNPSSRGWPSKVAERSVGLPLDEAASWQSCLSGWAWRREEPSLNSALLIVWPWRSPLTSVCVGFVIITSSLQDYYEEWQGTLWTSKPCGNASLCCDQWRILCPLHHSLLPVKLSESQFHHLENWAVCLPYLTGLETFTDPQNNIERLNPYCCLSPPALKLRPDELEGPLEVT